MNSDQSPSATKPYKSAANERDSLSLVPRFLLRQGEYFIARGGRVARTAMLTMPTRLHGVPDMFFAKRVSLLVDTGRLESQGDLRRMRFSET